MEEDLKVLKDQNDSLRDKYRDAASHYQEWCHALLEDLFKSQRFINSERFENEAVTVSIVDAGELLCCYQEQNGIIEVGYDHDGERLILIENFKSRKDSVGQFIVSDDGTMVAYRFAVDRWSDRNYVLFAVKDLVIVPE
jgi:hypothetical protein